jgi:hypothetical protein
MIITMKKILAGVSLLFLMSLSVAVNEAGATGQSIQVIQSAVPRTTPAAAPAPAPALVAAPRDEDQVAVKDKEQDFVLQKAARN